MSVNTEDLPVRSGPASNYKRVGTLESLSGRIYRYCTAKNKAGNTWWYGKVSSPSYKTVTGWVYGGYF
ncbi:hypothetical protein ACFVYR_10480 [Streptomyces sp. NPDC058284]|uniref:hypothetical protein n=1 Tax=unclassified Streptomyces TaxID=2593676 RepID=UPI00365FC7C2